MQDSGYVYTVPVKNFTGRKFVRYILFTRNRLFFARKYLVCICICICKQHGTGYLRSYTEPARFFSAIYHVNMRRSILFSVMAPKRKAADVEENDSTDTEKYFTWTDEEVSLLLQIATAYKNEI